MGVSSCASAEDQTTWESIKAERFDMSLALLDTTSDCTTADGDSDANGINSLSDIVEIEAATNCLDSAVRTALTLPEEEEDEHVVAQTGLTDDFEHDEEQASLSARDVNAAPWHTPRPKCDHIQLTKEVLRWLDRQDSKYRGFFIRRICQLADGDRSRILQKSLTGTNQTAVWETYLDQKSGQRILWTEYKYEEEQSIVNNSQHQRGLLIWHVAKHDNVSRLIKLIDDAERRSRNKLTTSAEALFCNEGTSSTARDDGDDNILTLDDNPKHILADPFANVPLKKYILRRDEVSKLAKSWRPPLHLTSEERKCVEKDGTVLLLGRSGTG